MWFYNFGLILYVWAIRLVAPRHPKARLWIEGRKDLFRRMREAIAPTDRIIWIHVASLGEFEQGRPIIEQLRKTHPEYKILLTFFSPSGYEIRKNYKGVDYIFYLPIDTPGNARRFLDAAHPEIAIFVKYEYWLNLLRELRRRKIRTYVVSAIFRRNSVFFRPYGGMWRQALESFDVMFVQNEESKKLLATLGFDNVLVAGDTRFDRVAEIARAARRIDVIDRFKGDNRLFVAGSTWEPDEELLIRLINDNPDVKFVVAPHEMDESRIARLMAETKGGALRYTQCTPRTTYGSRQLLILDTVGILASVYGYATWSYIGGGFGVGIHNTLEAATFGLPVAFGPNYEKFKEARDLVTLGAARSVTDYEQLRTWFVPLRDNEEFLQKTSRIAKDYTTRHQGATGIIVKTIFLAFRTGPEAFPPPSRRRYNSGRRLRANNGPPQQSHHTVAAKAADSPVNRASRLSGKPFMPQAANMRESLRLVPNSNEEIRAPKKTGRMERTSRTVHPPRLTVCAESRSQTGNVNARTAGSHPSDACTSPFHGNRPKRF